MTRIDGVIFDWGNTLVDYPLRTGPEQHRFLASFLLDHADILTPSARIDIRSAASDDAWLAAFNRENDDFAVRPFGDRLRPLLGDGLAPGLLDELERHLCKRIFDSGLVIDGAVALVTQIRQAGLPVCILSNTPWGTSSRLWRQELERHPVSAGASIVLCGDVGYRKPHRAAFRRCLDELGTAPTATVMIGDSLSSDIVGAAEYGLSAVWYKRADDHNPSGYRTVETLLDLTDLLKI
jgi:FMN phosphatase YigB (HAD superfamily)